MSRRVCAAKTSLHPRRQSAPLFALLFVVIGHTLTLGCAEKSRNSVERSSSWDYPIELGDPHARVQELLGGPSHFSPELEDYPSSGLAIWFDHQRRVSKLMFYGAGSTLYALRAGEILVSPRAVLFGLTPRSDEEEFQRALGAPITTRPERATAVGEWRSVWRKDGFVLDALFLRAARMKDKAAYPPGTLVWFEVYRGL